MHTKDSFILQKSFTTHNGMLHWPKDQCLVLGYNSWLRIYCTSYTFSAIDAYPILCKCFEITFQKLFSITCVWRVLHHVIILITICLLLFSEFCSFCEGDEWLIMSVYVCACVWLFAFMNCKYILYPCLCCYWADNSCLYGKDWFGVDKSIWDRMPVKM